jgi:hypothetical protein
MEQAELDRIRQLLDEQVHGRFPEGAVERVEVLQYGDDPEVEPGQLLAQVVLNTPSDEEGRKQAFESLHDSHRAAFGELRNALNKLPVNVVLRFVAGGGHAEGDPAGPFIRMIGPKTSGPGGDAPGLTPVMARLGADDLETLDTLIAAGIATSRADAVRWALTRIRERPAYGQLRARTREIEELKSQF